MLFCLNNVRFGFIAFAVSLAIGVSTATAAGGDTFDVAYRVMVDGRDLGRINVVLTNDDSLSRLEALTIPEGVARLLANEVTERFTFQPGDAGWNPIAYSEAEGNQKPFEMRFAVGDELVASYGDATSRHPPDSLVEPQGFPLASYLVSPDRLHNRIVLMPTDRGIRAYRYRLEGEERVTIGDRSYETYKWLKQRSDRDSRGFFIWNDKSTGIPVRVRKFRKSRTMTMELESMKPDPN
ncbi:MAG: hypothetical protein DWQ08_08995 [Proteobacteria bacterium]|nr:MAG: hypothetical protein DWQ08_08995 [Pseudomonadota bacterium]